jgi:hypothetical protein
MLGVRGRTEDGAEESPALSDLSLTWVIGRIVPEKKNTIISIIKNDGRNRQVSLRHHWPAGHYGDPSVWDVGF